MQKCVLLVKVYMLIDTNEVKMVLTRFTLGDAEMLKQSVLASFLILPQTALISVLPEHGWFQDSFQETC